jgi:hypothetical protein
MADYIVVHSVKVATDFAPQTFGRLTTIGPVFWLPEAVRRHRPYQVCRCECGNTMTTKVRYLLSGDCKSCGCLRDTVREQRCLQHGLASTAEYRAWNAARIRCSNPNDVSYKNYGRRGIHMCSRWTEPDGQGFLNFLQDMGPRPGGKFTIERKRVNEGYCPENCEWADWTAQGRNRRNSVLLTAFGKTQCLSAWAEEYNLSWQTLASRLRRGWPAEKALTTIAINKRKPK